MLDPLQLAEPPSPQHLLGPLSDAERRRLSGAHVVIAGLGNIGSFLAMLLGPLIGSLRQLDRGTVEAKNVWNQVYRPADAGRTKVSVVAAALRDRFERLPIVSSAIDLEDAPLRWFAEADLVFGALHSLRGRQALISERCWPLGVPVVDGAVGESWLGRVVVLRPDSASACFECNWGSAHYRQLAQEYPCLPGGDADAPPTLSPCFLGAAVAGVMAAQGVQVLLGGADSASREITFDLAHARFAVSTLRRARGCRFDHELPSLHVALGVPFFQATVGDVLDVIAEHGSGEPFHVESRRIRTSAVADERTFFTQSELHALRSRRLTELGLTADDTWRVRFAHGRSSQFVWLDEHLPKRGENR